MTWLIGKVYDLANYSNDDGFCCSGLIGMRLVIVYDLANVLII
jgi:hypothetical protein